MWKLLARKENAHNMIITSVAYSHDGEIIMSASKDRKIKLWSYANGTITEKKMFDGKALTLAGKFFLYLTWNTTKI